jgi:hypothetical protein
VPHKLCRICGDLGPIAPIDDSESEVLVAFPELTMESGAHPRRCERTFLKFAAAFLCSDRCRPARTVCYDCGKTAAFGATPAKSVLTE